MMNYMDFLLEFHQKVQSYGLTNHPSPIVMHHNGYASWKLVDDNIDLYWLYQDHVGLAFQNTPQNGINVFPYYFHMIHKSFEIYRHTDLHKPKTEELFIKAIYSHADQMHEEFSRFGGSFHEFAYKLQIFIEWMNYTLRTVRV